MRRLLLLPLAVLALAPATAHAAITVDKSDNVEYVGRVASPGLVEGKVDGDVLGTTGRFGFRTYDVSDPADPQLLDSFMPAEILGASGYWQDEDMVLDTRRKLIIGALDPRHDDVQQDVCPGTGTLGSKNRDPDCRSGFYVISYADPSALAQVGDFVELPAGHTASCIEGCDYIWTGGPARRDDLADLDPFTAGGRGDGRPIWVTNLKDPEHPETTPSRSTCGATTA